MTLRIVPTFSHLAKFRIPFVTGAPKCSVLFCIIASCISFYVADPSLCHTTIHIVIYTIVYYWLPVPYVILRFYDQTFVLSMTYSSDWLYIITYITTVRYYSNLIIATVERRATKLPELLGVYDDIGKHVLDEAS